ncbi:MAG: phage/plasmid replication protein, II/X family [Minisyncoccota bacterium]
MIDWFSGHVGYDASRMVLGQFFEMEPGGEIVRHRDRWETARGSWESGVQVTRGQPTSAMLKASREMGFLCSETAVLRVSGNPAKFLQGHNVAGPSVSQLGPVVQALVRCFGECFRPIDADDDRLPALHRTRVDVTTAVDLGTHQAVHDWLRAAEALTSTRGAPAVSKFGTVYWRPNSTRWTLKAYCKHCELKAHPAIDPGMVAELSEWTRTQLRIELTLRRPELKARGVLDEGIIWEYAGKLEMPKMRQGVRLEDVQLPSGARFALQAWLDGHDVAVMVSRPSFYRYRRSILDSVGWDIGMNAADQVKADSSALVDFDELQRREVVEIPERIQRSLFGAA